MSPDLTDKTFEGRFKFEAELIAVLDHPYIVPIYDFGTEDNQMFIVMRFMSGGTLMDRIRYEEIPVPDIVPIIERIGDVLDTIHARGIIHRDLKPGNILFNERGEAFLGDFGVAKNIIQPGGFTATDMILGTIDYMSPEQIQGGKNLDGRTDVYALGIMIFYILTGSASLPKEIPLLAQLWPISAIPSPASNISSPKNTVLGMKFSKKHYPKIKTVATNQREHSLKTSKALVKTLYPDSA